jgi:hypothetical protein
MGVWSTVVAMLGAGWWWRARAAAAGDDAEGQGTLRGRAEGPRHRPCAAGFSGPDPGQRHLGALLIREAV